MTGKMVLKAKFIGNKLLKKGSSGVRIAGVACPAIERKTAARPCSLLRFGLRIEIRFYVGIANR